MTKNVFFRLLTYENKQRSLRTAVASLLKGSTVDVDKVTYLDNPQDFRQVPGSPFTYWVNHRIRRLFTRFPSFESGERKIKQGLATADDFRFVRAWWEVEAAKTVSGTASSTARSFRQKTFEGKRWVPFAKGGSFSPYYADLHLVVNWERDGSEIRNFIDPKTRRPYSRPQNTDFYFRPGLTWSYRPMKRGSFRALPVGSVFSVNGSSIFWTDDANDLYSCLPLLNSSAYNYLVQLQFSRGTSGAGQTMTYEVGYVSRTPVPTINKEQHARLAQRGRTVASLVSTLDTTDESSHAFELPALLELPTRNTLRSCTAAWENRVAAAQNELLRQQGDIDNMTFEFYGLGEEDRQIIQESLQAQIKTSEQEEDRDGLNDADAVKAPHLVEHRRTLVGDLLSYAVGCVFGRWDARIALDSSMAAQLADPFAPLPVCSPGMLVGPDALPAQRDGIASEEWMRARPDAITPPPDGAVEKLTIPDTEYALAVDWDGILVDDPDHPDDVVRRVRGVLELLWGECADAVEGEACELLGVKDFRTFFRNPRQFFDHHIKRYSKSRRKAPIYWLLQSPKRNYGLWLYYHRLDPDILFKALTKYVEPKVRLEESRLEEYEARRRSAGTGGREAKQAEKAVEKQEELLTDLREFRDRLERAAKLHLRPDLNDGVVLNIAPLHELVPWKEAKSKWNELLAGKYEWSSIGKQLREKGMV